MILARMILFSFPVVWPQSCYSQRMHSNMAAELNALPAEVAMPQTDEDAARAGVYALFGSLLRDVPDARLLAQVKALQPTSGRDAFVAGECDRRRHRRAPSART